MDVFDGTNEDNASLQNTFLVRKLLSIYTLKYVQTPPISTGPGSKRPS